MKRVNIGNELFISRIFDAPRRLVWKAWTDKDMLMRWWGPEGFTTPVFKMDVRVGGEYLYCMRSPEGRDYWGKGIYRQVVPEEKLVMIDSFADEKGHTVPASHYGMSDFAMEMLISVRFDDEEGKTRVTLVHSGIKGISDKDRENMRIGWNQSLNKLAAYLVQAKHAVMAA